MAGLMEMYQILKDMQDTQIANRPEHPDSGMARSASNVITQFQQGQKDYEVKENAKIERAKKLMEMANQMNSLSMMGQAGVLSDSASQLMEQAKILTRSGNFDEAGKQKPITNTSSSKVNNMFDDPNKAKEFNISPSGVSIGVKDKNIQSGKSPEEIEKIKAETNFINTQSKSINEGKGRYGSSGGSAKTFSDKELLSLIPQYEKLSQTSITDEEKVTYKEYVKILQNELKTRDIGQDFNPIIPEKEIDPTLAEKARKFFGGMIRGTKTMVGLGSNAPKAVSSDRVTVIDPSGKEGTIPKSQLAEARKQGYKLK